MKIIRKQNGSGFMYYQDDPIEERLGYGDGCGNGDYDNAIVLYRFGPWQLDAATALIPLLISAGVTHKYIAANTRLMRCDDAGN